MPEYVEYLRNYARHFKLNDRIRLGCRVTKIWRDPSGGHLVEFVNSKVSSQAHAIHADYIAVCSGLHVIPSIPDIPGIEHVLHPKLPPADCVIREVYHSSSYKGRAQLANRRVLILGTGETGHDLAYEAVKAGATEVTLCTRGRFALLGFVGCTPCTQWLLIHRRLPIVSESPGMGKLTPFEHKQCDVPNHDFPSERLPIVWIQVRRKFTY